MKTIKYLLFGFLFLSSNQISYGQFLPPSTAYSHLWAIKKNQTGSGKTEVHLVNRNTNYQSFIFNTISPVDQIYTTNYQFIGSDFNSTFPGTNNHPALWMIKKNQTGTNSTEVHILNPYTSFSTYLNQTGTALPETNGDWDFAVGGYSAYASALYAIHDKNTSSGNFEVKVIPSNSNFSTVVLNTTLPIALTNEEWQYSVGMYNGDDYEDLYMFRINNPNGSKSDKIEIHVRNGADGFQTSLLDVVTPLATMPESKVRLFCGLYPHTSAYSSDVFAVIKNGTSSGKTELHILDKSTNYTTYYHNVATILEQTYDNFEFTGCLYWPGASEEQKQNETDQISKNTISNYPNPFNPSTSFNYNVKEYSKVSIEIYDLAGRVVAHLVNELKDAGNYSVNFDGSNLSSGVYIYRAIIGNEVFTNKVILQK